MTDDSSSRRPDPVDDLTGECADHDGAPPPRTEDLTTLSYRGLPDELLWEELTRSAADRPLAVVGLKEPGAPRGVLRGRSLVGGDTWDRAVSAVLALDGVRRADDDRPAPRLLDDRPYPALRVELPDLRTLSELRALSFVDYVEPLNILDGIGCALPVYALNPADELFSPEPGKQPESRVAWSFRHMGIQDAWGLFRDPAGVICAPGGGVTIGIVDTGLFADAPQLDPATFVLPPGTRSPVRRLDATGDPTVTCSHGTRMAGLATAPAAGPAASGAGYAGVAWGADLVSVKVGNGVVHAGTSVFDLVRGIDMAVAAGARVITLALGMPYASDYVRDHITRVHDDPSHPEVLFVASAGTNVPWVTFPATMTRETLAVTLVDFRPDARHRYRKQAGLSYLSELVSYGPAVDLAAVNGPGATPAQGNTATPLTTLGGSSSAAALVAGIAALAWARIPQLSRQELIGRLAASASLAGIEGEGATAGRSAEVGWGIPDAYVAAGGARRAAVQGPERVAPGARYRLSATMNGYEPFFTYLWDTGETSQEITAKAGPSGSSRLHTVTVTNSCDGSTLTATLRVHAAGVRLRTLYSDQLVSEQASFFLGKRVDRAVNTGRELPEGCTVAAVRGLEYVRRDGALVPTGSPAESRDNGHSGFTVQRPGGLGGRSLDAVVHAWHDGLHAVHVRVAYDVWELESVDCVQPGVTRAAP
ncbi:S8 family serine peptidase [Streptomyces sp. NPDC059866]|uniref:S8 family serine peptidase n=1 Tax=Streptomyces sp. NPDC059866 TaxID=3346978 RepID=UPI0036641D81